MADSIQQQYVQCGTQSDDEYLDVREECRCTEDFSTEICEASVSTKCKCTSENRFKSQILSQYPLVVSFLASNLVHLAALYSVQVHRRGSKPKSGEKILTGTICAVVSVLLTRPLWVASSRLARREALTHKCHCSPAPISSKEHGLWKELVLIGGTEGAHGLWRGCSTSVLMAALNSPLQSIFFEALHQHCASKDQRHHKPKLATLATLISIMITSRCASTLITYPIYKIQQRHLDLCPHRAQSFLGSARHIASLQGPSGFFKGLAQKLTHTCLLSALLALTHPKIMMYILQIYMARNLLGRKR